MKLTQIVIIILVVAAFTSGIGVFWNVMIETAATDLSYTNRNSTDFSVFNATANITDRIDQSLDKIQDSQTEERPTTGLEFIGGISSFLSNAAETAYMVFLSAPNILVGLVTDMGVKTGLVPSWFGWFINAIIGIIVLGAVFYLVWGREV